MLRIYAEHDIHTLKMNVKTEVSKIYFSLATLLRSKAKLDQLQRHSILGKSKVDTAEMLQLSLTSN